MARTFNRNPVQVNAPSSNDIKDYYFNHTNWNGVNLNKNHLTVDQESFADSNNVYIDGEGVLRSRPAIKRSNTITDLVNVWYFDDVTVTMRKSSSDKNYNLTFAKGGFTSIYTNDPQPELIPYGDKIFIFASDYAKWINGIVEIDAPLMYYDKTSGQFINASDLIYIPKTEVDSLGVETKVESANLFTDKAIKAYLYNKETGISPDAYGKDFTVTLDNEKYSLNWDVGTEQLMVDNKFKLIDNYFLNGELMMDVRSDGASILYDVTNRTLRYSVTGNSFTSVSWLDASYGDVISKPKFSQDGRHAAIATTNGLYVITLVPIDGMYEYANFTDILADKPLKWVSGATVAFDIKTCDDFVITYNHLQYMYVVHYYEDLNQVYLIYSENLGGLHENAYSVIPKSISYNSEARISTLSEDKGLIAIASDFDSSGATLIYVLDSAVSKVYYDRAGRGNTTVKVLMDKIIWSTDEGIYGVWQEYDDDPNDEIIEIKTQSTSNKKPVISTDGGKILYGDGIYFSTSDKFLPLIVKSTDDTPIAFTNDIYYYNDEHRMLTSNTQKTFELEYAIDGDYSIPADFKWCQLSDFYFAIDNKLYISEYRENDDEFFAWYFPKYNVHEFDSKILNLLPISATEVAIFLKDSLWYVSKTDSAYTVNKSKLELNVTDGFDVISSPDGTLTMFCTDRGFVALSYQDFIASTEQSLTFLSDVIYDKIKEFVKNPVKLFKHDFWITLYQNGSKDGFIFDMRNNSWWPVSWNRLVDKVSNTNTGIMILSDGKQYHVDRDVYSYYDYDGGKSIIDWSITSQKLHLSAINNYKHLSNITFTSMLDASDTDEPVTYNMDILNYRKFIDIGGDTKIVSYKVDILRTYVQRLNYPKVNEFQYTLSTDHENTKQLPLSLSSITLKYKITGQVR